MPLPTRTLTGKVLLPSGDPLPIGVLGARPVGTMPTSPDLGEVLLPAEQGYAIINGEITAAEIVAGATYEFTVYDPDTRVILPPFRAPVSDEVETGITFEDLYSTATTLMPVGVTLLELLALYQLYAERGEPGGYAPLDSAGKLPLEMMPEGAGTGDMHRDDYDTDLDGKVNAAEHADTAGTATAAPWAGITGAPATFPPATHDHDDRYYLKTVLDALFEGKADIGHTHPLEDVLGLIAALAAKANSADLGTAAALDVGTAPGNIPQFEPSTGYYPVGDGRNLTNVGKRIAIDVVLQRMAAGQNAQVLSTGVWNLRLLNALASAGETGAVVGNSGVTTNMFQLPAGRYRMQAGAAHTYAARYRVRLRTVNTANTAQADPTNPYEFYAQGAAFGDNYNVGTQVETGWFTLTAATWFALESRVESGGGSPSEGGYPSVSAMMLDGTTPIPEDYARVVIFEEI